MSEKHKEDHFWRGMVSTIASETIVSTAISSVTTLINGKLDRDHATLLEEKRQRFQMQLAAQTAQDHRERLAFEAESAAAHRKSLLKAAQIQREATLEAAQIQGQATLGAAQIQGQATVEAAQIQGQATLGAAQMQIESSAILAHQQHKYALNLADYSFMLERWPLYMPPTHFLSDHHQGKDLKARQLTIFIVPPKITTTPSQKSYSFVINEKRVKSFIEETYPYGSNRPTRLLDGAWAKPELRDNASVEILHKMLQSESILILQPDVDDDDLLLQVAYWGLTQEDYWSSLIRFKIPSHKLLTGRKKSGDERSIEQYRDSNVNGESSKAINRAFTNLLCFIASWFTDAHHLIHADHPENVPPLLPKVLPGILGDPTTQEVIQTRLVEYITKYQSVFEALKQEQPDIIPTLALQLAEALCQLPDKMGAREYVLYSLQSRVEHYENTIAEEDLSNLLKAVVYLQDREYVTRLKRCLIQLEDTQLLELFKNLETMLCEDLLHGKVSRDEKGKTLYDLF